MFTFKYFDEAILDRKLILYGADENGINTVLDLYKYDIAYLCDDDEKSWNTDVMGIPVYPPLKLLEENKEIIVLITTNLNKNEIMLWLIEHGIDYLDLSIFECTNETDNKIWMDINNTHIMRVARHYLLERCRNRKLLIWGTGDEAIKLSKLLFLFGFGVGYYIDNISDDDIFENKTVRPYVDIAYEEPNSFFVIITGHKESYRLSRRKLLQLGMIEDIDFTYYMFVSDNEFSSCRYDVTLSYNRIRDEIEGFEVFGDVNNPTAIKIVALGGSTTESTYNFVKSWTQYLVEMLQEKKIPVILYCGGIVGYTSSQELLKLIRDVISLKPDIVLSYSGFNDSFIHNKNKFIENRHRPFITNWQVNFIKKVMERYPKEEQTVFYGLENNTDVAEHWLNNTKMMYAISKEFNILFLSFIQPYLYNGKYKIHENQKAVFKRTDKNTFNNDRYFTNKRIKRIKLIVSLSKDYKKLLDLTKNIEYITDLTGIFEGNENVIYQDIVHVYEQGNEIVAKNIYMKLLPYLKNK